MVAGDFIVDGCPLLEQCERAAKQVYGVVSPMGWTPPDYQQSFVNRLLLQKPALLPSGRRELLVCPQCADLGCGCISADVSFDGECFVWNEIGYENDYDPESIVIFPMGRFIFPKDELRHELRQYVADLL